MKRALILSAGRGSRLLPLTESRPKCLVALSGRSILRWQVDALASVGFREFHVVTGFAASLVEREVSRLAHPGRTFTVHFNPFYNVAENLSSCWIARSALEDDVFVLNGDTLLSPELVDAVVCDHEWPIALAVAQKATYDADDMKVHLDGNRLTAVGKTLGSPDGESTGILAMRSRGTHLFRGALEARAREPSGIHDWYFSLAHELAATGYVGAVSVTGNPWAEIDVVDDLPIATELTTAWITKPWAQRRMPPRFSGEREAEAADSP